MNNNTNIFEKAARLKLRFGTAKGEVSIEELWDLSLTSLDNLARAVNKRLKEESEESFIAKRSMANTELELKLDVLKHVIATKQDENEIARTKAEKKAQVEFMKTLLQKKKLDALESLPVEEIEKQLATLEAEV